MIARYDWSLLADSSLKYPAEIGPECVKTLSHLVCPSPLLLGVVIYRAFATISTGGASERL